MHYKCYPPNPGLVLYAFKATTIKFTGKLAWEQRKLQFLLSTPSIFPVHLSLPMSLLFCLALDPHSPGAGLGKGTLNNLMFIKQMVRLPLTHIYVLSYFPPSSAGFCSSPLVEISVEQSCWGLEWESGWGEGTNIPEDPSGTPPCPEALAPRTLRGTLPESLTSLMAGELQHVCVQSATVHIKRHLSSDHVPVMVFNIRPIKLTCVDCREIQ